MRNVFKGYQASKMAMPKMHVAKINQSFNSYHAPTLHRPVLRIERQQTAKTAGRPGRNPGIGRYR